MALAENSFSPQCFNETTLNKAMLFKDLTILWEIGASFQVGHLYPCQIITFLLLISRNSRPCCKNTHRAPRAGVQPACSDWGFSEPSVGPQRPGHRAPSFPLGE